MFLVANILFYSAYIFCHNMEYFLFLCQLCFDRFNFFILPISAVSWFLENNLYIILLIDSYTW